MTNDFNQLSKWERFWSGFADLPWPLVIVAVLIYLLMIGAIDGNAVSAAVAGAGLFAVGHGIHTGSKNLRRP